MPCQLVKQLPTVQDLAFQGETGLLDPEDEGTVVQTFWLFKPADDGTMILQNELFTSQQGITIQQT